MFSGQTQFALHKRSENIQLYRRGISLSTSLSPIYRSLSLYIRPLQIRACIFIIIMIIIIIIIVTKVIMMVGEILTIKYNFLQLCFFPRRSQLSQLIAKI